MEQASITIDTINELNKNLPVHNMWDGFWIHYYEKDYLMLSCSFDRIYYRDFDIEFRGVIFFNLPDEWRDTDIQGDELIRLSDKEEFGLYHPDFDTGEHTIMAIDIYFDRGVNTKKQTFFVVAKSVFLQRIQQNIRIPTSNYVDIYANEKFPCFKNRVM